MTNLESVLTEMHVALAAELLARILSGNAKPADLECARKLLLDNDIQSLPGVNAPMMKLADALPFPESEVG